MIFSNSDLSFIKNTVFQAGQLILEIYNTDFDVDYKDDQSPLTIADQQANTYLVNQLSERFPDIHFITEETKLADYKQRKRWEYIWIIDPLDGTKEFVKKNGEFTVNVALCHQNEIIYGAVYIPVTGEYFYAQKGKGAFKIDRNGDKKYIKSSVPKEELVVMTSRSHRSAAIDEFVKRLEQNYKQITFQPAGSSLKICSVAEGKAHIYPRLGPTMEWDVAAGIIIAQEAGASVYSYDTKEKLLFNKENLLNPFFIVSSLPEHYS